MPSIPDRPQDPDTFQLTAAFLLAFTIFALDTLTRLQSAVTLLYVLVPVIADDGRRGRGPTIFLCGFTCILAGLGFLLHHGIEAGPGATLRWLFSFAAIVVTAVLILRNGRIREAARVNDFRYRSIFDTLAVAIWEHDFREVKREMSALRASGVSDMRAYLRAHPEFVMSMRRLVRITNANETALSLLKVPEGAPFFTHLSQILPDDDDSFLDGLIALEGGARLFEAETRFRTHCGEYVDAFVALTFPPDIGYDRICVSVTDITERKRIQGVLDRTRTELDRAIRLATVGEMSASIAHEVSQPLTAVRTYTDAACRWLSKTPPNAKEALGAMQQSARAAANAGEVVNRVRRLISRAAPELTLLDVDRVIETAIDLASGQLADADVILDLNADMGRILGDQILLQQLLINVFNNALEAAGGVGRDDPRILVETRIASEDVRISIVDNGRGLTQEATVRAFDPFFSTREGGVGLGLAMCKSIVAAHGGRMTIEALDYSEGAKVTITLPLAAS